MVQDDLKPGNSRPGEANTKAAQPEKSQERHPEHKSELDEQGKVFKDKEITHKGASKASAGGNEYRIW